MQSWINKRLYGDRLLPLHTELNEALEKRDYKTLTRSQKIFLRNKRMGRNLFLSTPNTTINSSMPHIKIHLQTSVTNDRDLLAEQVFRQLKEATKEMIQPVIQLCFARRLFIHDLDEFVKYNSPNLIIHWNGDEKLKTQVRNDCDFSPGMLPICVYSAKIHYKRMKKI